MIDARQQIHDLRVVKGTLIGVREAALDMARFAKRGLAQVEGVLRGQLQQSGLALRAPARQMGARGAAPYGYARCAGRLVECPREQEVLAVARRLRGQNYTLAETAADLNRQGFKTRKSRAWTTACVRNILQSTAPRRRP